MQIHVRYLENLKVEARFDDHTLVADQPIRYKGNGTAPGPFDYFLASSAMCAAYFVKVYCQGRNIPTDDIQILQNNIVNPENRYQQTFHLQVALPASISAHDREGILKSIDRCTVKKVIQQMPEFKIELVENFGIDFIQDTQTHTTILGKDASLEDTILNMSEKIAALGIKIEIASWRNPVPYVWSVHIRDADSPMCFTNGKGASKDAALASALGEFLERLSNNYFYNDYYLGEEIAHSNFVHYPEEKWFKIGPKAALPDGLMDDYLLDIYNPDGELNAFHLIDTNSGNIERGICALPYIRQSDQKEVFIPVNLIGNLFVSNGMSAGNSKYEARVQCLSEIFERAVKNKIILEEIALPDVPMSVLQKYPKILEGIQKLEAEGFPIIIKDASLGGQFPVINITLINPKNGGVFASFGAHPNFEVALERTLTELLQGRSFEGFNVLTPPTFNEFAIREHNNIIDHFIDSTGVISWKFFSDQADYDFVHWNFKGTTEDEYHFLMNILKTLDKEVYIADFSQLGVYACRILVPDYSEIYQKEDLIWDNNNKALNFRDMILNLHSLSKVELSKLIKKFDESELDDYMKISELIGVAFDENSVWGQLTILELKALIFLATKKWEEAKSCIEIFLTFNDNTKARTLLYQAVNTLLDIELSDDLKRANFISPLSKMMGYEVLNNAISLVDGSVKFLGLTPTNSNLDGLTKHLQLIASYKKLHRARSV